MTLLVPGTTSSPRLLQPGLPMLPGQERHRLEPGTSLTLRLRPGDRLRVVDLQGRQQATAWFEHPDAVGLAGSQSGNGSDPLVRLFGEWSPAGETAEFTATGSTACRVDCLAGSMTVLDAVPNPPSPVRIYLDRADPLAALEPVLPEPLARPLQLDLRIDAATAQAYQVKAGQWIQIIDVEGRQCSDLLAFSTRKLDGGAERNIDMTTTRTLMGALYPGPGLYSKYFDQDMTPLLEVVRDTCGRHDTFGLACTAKYYEDLGYPGHTNCTDNFNAALDPYGMAPRRGWQAVNLWYNTGLDATNAIVLDEPWSRPGDYVLLRALTDLVVGSSACPDDVDPTNAWNPTDIHVRVYDADRTFTKGIAHRVTPDAEPTMTKETAFAPRWGELTRRTTEYRGYWLPTSFSGHGAVEEYWACREKAVLIDLSPLRKFEVTGPDAEDLLQLALTRNIRKLSVGQVVYTAICAPTGGMIDDGTVFRLGENLFRFVGGDPYSGVWLRELAQQRELRAWVKDSTDQLHNLAVQGPASRDLLRQLLWTSPAQPTFDELTWFRFAPARIGGPDGIPLVVSRTGYTGELGYELWCHPKHAVAIWDAVWQAGRTYGLIPLGLDALDVVRIEAGLVFAGYEFDDQTDPFEAGIGFTVALAGDEDFVGKEALVRRKANPQRALVGLELAGTQPVGHGDCVHDGRTQIGVVTSGCRSPYLDGRHIALARLDIGYTGLGTQLEVGKIDGHQQRVPATVVRFPFYDPDKVRPRS
jgi:aminomethyltransferase